MQTKTNLSDTLRDGLWKLSGGDYIIIKACDKTVKDTFASVGLLVCLNFILCFISGMYTVYHFLYTTFQHIPSLFLSIPIASFFAWMVINIYLVLLSTLSKNTLPHLKDVIASRISLGIRIMFVLFVAVVISKPIESFTFQNSTYITKELESHRSQLINDIIGNNSRLSQLDKKEITNKINENYFFSLRLRKVNFIPLAWGITLLIIALFFLPSIITFKMSEKSLYYYKKRKLERKLITDEYTMFLEKYKKCFMTSVERTVEFKPVCIVTEYLPQTNPGLLKFSKQWKIEVCYPSKNPPFNTKPLIPNRIYKKESDFITLIHNPESGY